MFAANQRVHLRDTQVNANMWLAETNLRDSMEHEVDNSISLIRAHKQKRQL